jgi:hypothetical protein
VNRTGSWRSANACGNSAPRCAPRPPRSGSVACPSPSGPGSRRTTAPRTAPRRTTTSTSCIVETAIAPTMTIDQVRALRDKLGHRADHGHGQRRVRRVHPGRARRPKIAELLALPEAAGVLSELRLARSMHVAPTALRGRRPRTRPTSTRTPTTLTGHRCARRAVVHPRRPGAPPRPRGLRGHPVPRLQAAQGTRLALSRAGVVGQRGRRLPRLHHPGGHQVAYSRLTTSVTDEDLATLPPFVWGRPRPRRIHPSQTLRREAVIAGVW